MGSPKKDADAKYLDYLDLDNVEDIYSTTPSLERSDPVEAASEAEWA